jgi:hypothetical protein
MRYIYVLILNDLRLRALSGMLASTMFARYVTSRHVSVYRVGWPFAMHHLATLIASLNSNRATCGFIFIVNHMNIMLGVHVKLLMGYCGCCGKVQSQKFVSSSFDPTVTQPPKSKKNGMLRC